MPDPTGQPTEQLLECAIDWVTATYSQGHPTVVMTNRATEWLNKRAMEGYRKLPWGWNGYTGQLIDGLSFGTRPDGFIIRLSGEMAKRHGAVALTFARNVTRLDLQVTIQTQFLQRNYAQIAHHQSQTDHRVQSGLTHTSIIESTPAGTTAYIGRRSSTRYMRCYDKSAESDGVYSPGTWRWECEYKRERAGSVAQRLQQQVYKPAAILDVVIGAFGSYGVWLPITSIPLGWRDIARRHETDDQKRLKWLQTSIRPMLGRLYEAYGREILLDVLGLRVNEHGEMIESSFVLPDWPRRNTDDDAPGDEYNEQVVESGVAD